MRIRTNKSGRMYVVLSPAEKEAQKYLAVLMHAGYSYHAAHLKLRMSYPQLSREFLDWLE